MNVRQIERKARTEEHVDSEGSWAISYGDMITLLLSFFVLYFTVDHSEARANKMQEELMVRLTEASKNPTIDALKSQLNIGDTPGEGVDPIVIKRFGGQVFQVGRALLVEFSDISFFELGNIEVTEVGAQALKQFVKLYMPFAANYQLSIQAFTDTRRVRSTSLRYRDNLELSALRSISAMRVLQHAGLPLNRMKIGGYGELIETQERLMDLKDERDPLKYTRKVVLLIESEKERN